MCAVTFHRDSIARWLTREVTGCRKDKCVLHRITNFRLKRRLRRGKIKSSEGARRLYQNTGLHNKPGS